MRVLKLLAAAAVFASAIPSNSIATEVRDGDMPTIGQRSQAEAYASTGVPWGKQTLSFVGIGNSNGQPLIIGLIETSVVKTCNDGSMVLQMQITGFNPYQNGKAPRSTSTSSTATNTRAPGFPRSSRPTRPPITGSTG